MNEYKPITGELRELLDIIENEAIAINNLDKGDACKE